MDRKPEAGTRRSVLYVEDHPINALLMSALFERRPNLELVLAENGLHAMTIAAGLSPVLILLDLRLPDCHGSQLLPLLRQLPGCEKVPAVAVTAEDDFVIEGTGFSEMWPKPLDLDRVLQRLDALTSMDPGAAETRPTERRSLPFVPPHVHGVTSPASAGLRLSAF